jgi:hypothetical protein
MLKQPIVVTWKTKLMLLKNGAPVCSRIFSPHDNDSLSLKIENNGIICSETNLNGEFSPKNTPNPTYIKASPKITAQIL